MTRKGKGKTQELELQEVVVTQEVKKQMMGRSFDLMLKFTGSALQPELYMDELVQMVIEGLLDHYGQIIVKVNWFADGLEVIVPDGIAPIDTAPNALQAPSEATTGTIDSNPSPNTES